MSRETVALVEIEDTLVLHKEGDQIEYNDHLINALLDAGISKSFLICKTTNFWRVKSYEMQGKTFEASQIEFIELLKPYLMQKGIQVMGIISPADFALHIDKIEAGKFLRECGALRPRDLTGGDLQDAIKTNIFNRSKENPYPAIMNFLENNNSELQTKPGTVYEGVCAKTITKVEEVSISYNLVGVASKLNEEGTMGFAFAFCASYFQSLGFQEVIYVTESQTDLVAVLKGHQRKKSEIYLSNILSEKGGESLASYKTKLDADLLAFKKHRLMMINEFLRNPLSGNNPLKEKLSNMRNDILSANFEKCTEIDRELLEIFYKEGNTNFKSEARTAAIRNSEITRCYNAQNKLTQLKETLNFSPLLNFVGRDMARQIVNSLNPSKNARALVSLAGTCRLFREAARQTHNNTWMEITRIARISKTLKVSLIGDEGTGRASLRDQFAFGRCHEDSPQDNQETCLDVYGEKVKFSIQPPKMPFFTHPSYFNPYKVDAIMLVFDLSDRRSFENILFWLKHIERYASDLVAKVLVGNKCDSVASRVVSFEEAKEFAEQLNIPYIETSAKSGHGVKKAFEAAASEYFILHEKPNALISSIPLAVARGK